MNTLPLQLRDVVETDCKMLFDWANDPVTRAASLASDPITWEQHKKWFSNKINNPQCIFQIGINAEGKSIGPVRFDIQGVQATISISVCPTCRSKGYGAKLARLACEKLFSNSSIQEIDAYAKKDNIVSVRLFEKVGFQKKDELEYRGCEVVHLALKKDQ